MGAEVVINEAADEPDAPRTAAAIRQAGAEAVIVQADVCGAAQIDGLFDAATESFEQIDLDVADAGVEIVNQPVGSPADRVGLAVALGTLPWSGSVRALLDDLLTIITDPQLSDE